VSHLWPWLDEVVTDWLAWIGGILVIFSLIEAIGKWSWSKLRYAPKAAWFFSILFLLAASYRAWNVEYTRILQMQQLSGRIDFAIFGAQRGNSSDAGIIATLRNPGTASAIDSGSWKLTATTPDSAEHPGSPITLYKDLNFCFPPHTVWRFTRKDALYAKSAQVIHSNSIVQGFLWFLFPDLTKSSLVNPRTILTLEATSVSGQHLQISTSLQALMNRSRSTEFIPGLEYPVPISTPCKENVPYH
jgi:hypothetical protein